jgi:hypothetical protein
MSTGGWGAVQYLEMFSNATLLRPRVIVVAFYTGNDPLESFMLTYADSQWDWLVPDSALDRSDAPHVDFPAPESEWWPVTFSDALKTVFTPDLRLAANRKHPAVAAGYEIMSRVMERMVEMSRDLDISVVATIIPTKELVYARRVEREGIEAPEPYRQLVRHEAENIRKLREMFAGLPGLVYVDVLGPLQAAAEGPHHLYPEDINGHPLATGYAVIGKAIAGKVAELLPGRLQGRYAHKVGEIYHSLLVTEDGYRLFSSPEVMEANGWPAEDVRVLTDRDLADIPFRGVIETVDAAQFGPGRFHR